MLKLIAIVGTNSNRSTNRQLLQYMSKHFADKAEIELVEIKDIPMFNKPADRTSLSWYQKLPKKSMLRTVYLSAHLNTTIQSQLCS